MKPRMYLLFAFLAVAEPLTYPQQVDAALADYARFSDSDKPYIRYGTLHSVPEAIKASEVQRFWLPHLSTQQVLERIMPQQITGTQFYRFDLRDLHWTLPAWSHVMESYPYDLSGTGNPLFVRMDWLTWVTSDAQLFSAYYDLLYGEKRFPDGKTRTTTAPVREATTTRHWPNTGGPRRGNERSKHRGPVKPTTYAAPKAKASGFPANSDEFFDFWRVDVAKNKEFHRAIVIDAGNSGVALHTRMAAFFPNGLGVASQTFDSETGVGEDDALNKLDGGLKFDATEAIVAMPKVSLKTGESFSAQAYLLTDGAQKTVNEASVRIVIDKSDKLPVIRTPGSCVRCHTSGILSLPENAVRAIIQDGVEVYTKDKDKAEAIERFFLLKLDRDVNRYQDDFGAFCEAVSDLEPAELTSEYSKLLTWYDQSVTLEQAAIETYAKDATELKLAIALYAARKGRVDTIRLATLAHGRSVPRGIWESDVFQQASAALALWRAR